jgi:hypothetical protein
LQSLRVFDPAILFSEKADLITLHVILLNQSAHETHGTDSAKRHDDAAEHVSRDG